MSSNLLDKVNKRTLIILLPNFSVCATYSPSISNIDDLLFINAVLPTIVLTVTDFPAPGTSNIAILAFAKPFVNVSKFIGKPVKISLPKYIPSFVLDFSSKFIFCLISKN